eukprot:UN10379
MDTILNKIQCNVCDNDNDNDDDRITRRIHHELQCFINGDLTRPTTCDNQCKFNSTCELYTKEAKCYRHVVSYINGIPQPHLEQINNVDFNSNVQYNYYNYINNIHYHQHLIFIQVYLFVNHHQRLIY